MAPACCQEPAVLVAARGLSHPRLESGDASVDAVAVRQSAASARTHDPDLAKSSVLVASDERAAAVALAGVLPALLEAGADVPLVDCPGGVGLLTGLAIHQRNLNLHQPICEVSRGSRPH